MKKKIIIIKILFMFLLVSKGYSQVPTPPMTALSPNAASLGLYGEVPVSFFTGVPDITIPLYNIVVKDYVLPISLSYHASGVRVDQRPGWTGLGWSLFAGGVITRSVNDKPDDFNTNNPFDDGGKESGYYFNYGVLNASSWNQRTYLRSVAQNGVKSHKDTAPDEFSFNFAGYSGKFYLDHTRNWAVQCNKPIKVEFNGSFLSIPFEKSWTIAESNGYSPCFNGFTITGEDGTKYIFGGTIDNIDFSLDFFDQHIDEWRATAWYLAKIILPSSHEISFTYERKEFNNQMYLSVYQDIGTWTEGSGGIFNLQPSCSSNSIPSQSYAGKLIAPVYLKKIMTDNAVVYFNKSISNELLLS
jgi:hypothetical protein